MCSQNFLRVDQFNLFSIFYKASKSQTHIRLSQHSILLDCNEMYSFYRAASGNGGIACESHARLALCCSGIQLISSHQKQRARPCHLPPPDTYGIYTSYIMSQSKSYTQFTEDKVLENGCMSPFLNESNGYSVEMG